jgi:pyruvate carboxylase subunit A
MQAAGIPIVPGSNTNLKGLDSALILAEQIGYPVNA